jgi:hypothetical protein
MCISKKYFRPGGMAPSEWTRSVRAVTDTPVADYSVPGVNSMGRVPDRPLIAVSPFFSFCRMSNNPGFRLKHPGDPDGSDGSDGTSYPLTENYTLPVSQAMGRIAQHSTWERQRQTCERLGAPRITVEHAGKNNIWECCWCAWNS